MKNLQATMGSLRKALDPESQLLFDEVTTKYLRPSDRDERRRAPVKATDRRVRQLYAEERFRSFVHGLGADRKTPIRVVLADPEFRLRAWQQVRQWDHDRNTGAWALREKAMHDRYRPRAAFIRLLYVTIAALMVMGLVVDGSGPVWAGIALLAATLCVQYLALPAGELHPSAWRAHTDQLAYRERPDSSGAE